ncbi:unnamed protein product [Anisakis simplex]|uniref:Uncharacterized protein n=2 Tax=Anisakis simplex TaxID=6269 RepID=A0A3P6NZH2_ANISI|nr:unnamed protein product [Anisakis simplex]
MISYYLAPGSDVPPLPHGNSKNNQLAYVRKCPSEVVRRSNVRGSSSGMITKGSGKRSGGDPMNSADGSANNNTDSSANISDIDDNTEVNVEAMSDDEQMSKVNVTSPDSQAKFFAISDEEMTERIAQLTSAIPFTRTFIGSISVLPVGILRADSLAVDVPVNRSVPQINLTGIGAQMTFIIDTTRIGPSELGADNLGS